MEKFVRRQNIEHYRELLKRTTDETQKQVLQELLAEEQAKQQDESPAKNKLRYDHA